jgi:anti-sigma regulatory factor (Ser/Thr protein kinase)
MQGMGTRPGVESYPAVGGSLERLRRDVRTLAGEAGAGARSGFIAQAASEAAANAIVHGYAGGDADAAVEVEIACEAGGLVVTVADRGTGFRPSRDSPGLGVGLALIAQLADELELRERAGGGVEVWMRFSPAT